MVCFVLKLENFTEKAATRSHSNFEPIVSHFIGEYLLLIISIIIIYWLRIRKGKRRTYISVCAQDARAQSVISDANVQLTQWNWSARTPHALIDNTKLCSLG